MLTGFLRVKNIVMLYGLHYWPRGLCGKEKRVWGVGGGRKRDRDRQTDSEREIERQRDRERETAVDTDRHKDRYV